MSKKRGAKGGWRIVNSKLKRVAGWPYLFTQTSLNRSMDTDRIARQAEADQARKKRGSWR